MTSFTIDIPLSISAHLHAEQFCGNQANPDKAKQIYLNTLAVYAVSVYLKSLGFQPELDRSSSWNIFSQTLMNTADLLVKNLGKLECRPVLPDAESVYVPEEVWTQRVGFIAVRLDESLKKATLLGFIPQVGATNFPCKQLRSILELPKYLSDLERPHLVTDTLLGQWLHGLFEEGWQLVEQLYPTPLAFNFRGSSQLQDMQHSIKDVLKGSASEATQIPVKEAGEISRVKLLNLNSGQQIEQVGLVVKILAKSDGEIDISVSVKVYPADGQTKLPQGLQISVLDEREVPVMQAQVNNTETVEFKFSGEPGEYFCVRLTWRGISKTETFVI
ncbi:MAG: DUF1822 family protein [Xenococcaceae cyanobacterium]